MLLSKYFRKDESTDFFIMGSFCWNKNIIEITKGLRDFQTTPCRITNDPVLYQNIANIPLNLSGHTINRFKFHPCQCSFISYIAALTRCMDIKLCKQIFLIYVVTFLDAAFSCYITSNTIKHRANYQWNHRHIKRITTSCYQRI